MQLKGLRTKTDIAAAILFLIVSVPVFPLIFYLLMVRDPNDSSMAFTGWTNLLMATIFFAFFTILGWLEHLKNPAEKPRTTEIELGLYSLGLSQIAQIPYLSYYFGGVAALCFLATLFGAFILPVLRRRNASTT